MNLKTRLSTINKEDRKDILELDHRIRQFKQGKEDEERFKLYRLTRGVYGQRQVGVQMFRLKIPFGKITSEQLEAIADISDQYSTGNLHLTTRQNIQMHYVKLDDSPAIWTALAEAGLTAREACGNTVRNITASARAGIDPDEPFDVSPYVQASFEYFLRNPICQEMGRKIKPAFSSSEKDSAFTYFHDFGFIPKIKNIDGQPTRGFKVLLGGGLGAVSMIAHPVYDFLPADQIIPFMEAAIRVFDRYGEREKRMKARMKFLVKKLGLDHFLELIEQERTALENQRLPIEARDEPIKLPLFDPRQFQVHLSETEQYALWLQTNVFEQKQKDFFGVWIKVRLGNISTDTARQLAALVRSCAANDIRITVNQGLLLRFVPEAALPYLFEQLKKLDLAEVGFDSTADITACPGTDTCALGVTNSTYLATVLENVIVSEYPNLLKETQLKIKISGCMNSCGQHMAAQIGFHGSSIKRGVGVVPAMQVVMGGGIDPAGKGFIAEKVIKLPTRRIPDALRLLLNDYLAQAGDYDYFNDFYQDKGKRYFYKLLQPLADLDSLREEEFQDWGQDREYVQSIGVGECAGVILDVVGTIIGDAKSKIGWAYEAFAEKAFADAIYHAYAGMIIGAKALLLGKDVKCNTHKSIINDFQEHYVDAGEFELSRPFPESVLQINQNQPGEDFAKAYLIQAGAFIEKVIETRNAQLVAAGGEEKLVIENYYKA
jgi:sulfite reductase (ferredoxin)